MKRIALVVVFAVVFAIGAYAETVTHEQETLTFGESIYKDYTVRYNYLRAEFDQMGLLRLYYLLNPYKSCKTAPESSVVECRKIKLVDVQVLAKENEDYVIAWKASKEKPSRVGFFLDTLSVEPDAVKEVWHNFLFDPPFSPFDANVSKVRWVYKVDGEDKQVMWDIKENTLTVSDLEDLKARSAPKAEPVKRTEIGKKMVHFPYSQWIIEPSEEEILQLFIDELNANPAAYLQVECHADPYGSDEYNVELSQKRAESVRDYLAAKGISPDRLVTKWFGKSQPVAECHTIEECRINRRCEIKLFLEESE